MITWRVYIATIF
jgi:hypothetical protein